MVPSADVRRVALAHCYENSTSGMVRPFDSLDELREALRPYRVQVSA